MTNTRIENIVLEAQVISDQLDRLDHSTDGALIDKLIKRLGELHNKLLPPKLTRVK